MCRTFPVKRTCVCNTYIPHNISYFHPTPLHHTSAHHITSYLHPSLHHTSTHHYIIPPPIITSYLHPSLHHTSTHHYIIPPPIITSCLHPPTTPHEHHTLTIQEMQLGFLKRRAPNKVGGGPRQWVQSKSHPHIPSTHCSWGGGWEGLSPSDDITGCGYHSHHFLEGHRVGRSTCLLQATLHTESHEHHVITPSHVSIM